MLKNEITPFQKVKKSLKPSELGDIHYLLKYVEAKYDGSRYRIRNKDHKINIFSKRISVVTDDFVDKTDNFPQFQCLSPLSDFDIDVEMVVGDGVNCRSSHVTKVAGSNPDRAVALQEEFGYLNAILINWYLLPSLSISESPLNSESFINIYNSRSKISKMYLPKQWLITREFTLEDAYKESVSMGYEGIMLKEGKYENAWAKVKKTDTWDYVIQGFQESESEDFKEKGWIGSIVFGYVQKFNSIPDQVSTCFQVNERVHSCRNKMFIKDMEIVPCGTCSGFDFILREQFSENPNKYIGMVIEIEGQELDKKLGVRHPRFISFREDKDALECTKESLLRRVDND